MYSRITIVLLCTCLAFVCGQIDLEDRVLDANRTPVDYVKHLISIQQVVDKVKTVFDKNLTVAYPKQYCGGVILNERWVMTAAHCVSLRKPALNHRIFAGVVTSYCDRNAMRDPTTYQIAQVQKIVKHPAFDLLKGENDIALLRLEQALRFSEKVGAAILPGKDFRMPAEGFIAGWGEQTNARTGYSPCRQLYKSTTPLITAEGDENFWIVLGSKDLKDLCRRRGLANLKEHLFCGGYGDSLDTPVGTTCRGDMGTGITVSEANPTVFGITVSSAGKRCGLQPSAYLEVVPYVDWIRSVISE